MQPPVNNGVGHYPLCPKKKPQRKKTKGDDHVKNHSNKTPSPIMLMPLVAIIIINSINLYSNSMISHNALPFLTLWQYPWIVHFYGSLHLDWRPVFLSTILLKGLKSSHNHHSETQIQTIIMTIDEMKTA